MKRFHTRNECALQSVWRQPCWWCTVPFGSTWDFGNSGLQLHVYLITRNCVTRSVHIRLLQPSFLSHQRPLTWCWTLRRWSRPPTWRTGPCSCCNVLLRRNACLPPPKTCLSTPTAGYCASPPRSTTTASPTSGLKLTDSLGCGTTVIGQFLITDVSVCTMRHVPFELSLPCKPPRETFFWGLDCWKNTYNLIPTSFFDLRGEKCTFLCPWIDLKLEAGAS